MSKYGKPYYKVLRVKTEPTDYFWIQNVSGNDNSFFVYTHRESNSKVEYSKDKSNWTKATYGDNWIYFDNNEKVYFRGRGGLSSNTSSYCYFNLQCDVNAGGNIGRFIDWTEDIVELPDYSFYSLFSSNSQFVKNISQLTFGSIKKIGRYSCQMMFRSANNITGTPDLSGIEEISECGMDSMFFDSGITATGDFSSLKTVGRYGMRGMFQQCSNLREIGDFSSLESIGYQGMWQMFANCYYASVTTGMDLSNVTTAGNNALYSCYTNCYKISEVTAPNIQDLTANGILTDWLSGSGIYATGTKTVNVPTGATITTGSGSGIPNDWTRVDY